MNKVYRMDFLLEVWRMVHRNRGSQGVDGIKISNIAAMGVDVWLRELSQKLREGTYQPQAIRQVLIPKKIPCVSRRYTEVSE